MEAGRTGAGLVPGARFAVFNQLFLLGLSLDFIYKGFV